MEKSPIRSDPTLIFLSGNRPLGVTITLPSPTSSLPFIMSNSEFKLDTSDELQVQGKKARLTRSLGKLFSKSTLSKLRKSS